MNMTVAMIPRELVPSDQARHEETGRWPVREYTFAMPEEKILVGYPEAARLLSCSVEALQMRVARGLIPGVVRTGRRVQFRLSSLRRIK